MGLHFLAILQGLVSGGMVGQFFPDGQGFGFGGLQCSPLQIFDFVDVVGYLRSGGIAFNTDFISGQLPTAQALLPPAHFGAVRPKIVGIYIGELKALTFCEVPDMGLGAHVVSGMVRQFTA